MRTVYSGTSSVEGWIARRLRQMTDEQRRSEDFVSRARSAAKALSGEPRRDALRALKELSAMGVDSSGSLVQIIHGREFALDARVSACLLASLLNEKRAVGPLLSAISDEHSALTWAAAKALIGLGSRRAVTPLLKKLGSDSNAVRRSAYAYVLGSLKDRRAVQPLIDIFRSGVEDAQVRGHAVEALAYLRDPGACVDLILGLKDASTEVRYWSAFALGELSCRGAVPRLRGLVAERLRRAGRHDSVSREALQAIGAIESASAKGSGGAPKKHG